MGTNERPSTGALIDQLIDKPHGFNLFQAISLLERAVPDAAPMGEGIARDEAVRLSAVVSLGFQPSDVASVSEGAVTGEHFTLSSPVLSLAGAQGPLPLPFTEMVLERRAARDRAMGEFLDIFNHRFLSFLYRGRKKHHIGLNWAATEGSSLAGVLDSLSALGLSAGARAPAGETSWLRHAGLMSGAPRSLSGLIALLTDRLGLKVSGQQFHGSWQRLAPLEVSRLGVRRNGPRLGQTAVLGQRAWDQSAGLQIEFSGLRLSRLTHFLPGGSEHALARWLIERYVQQEVRVELILRPLTKDIGHARLGGNEGMRLGWTSWLQSSGTESAAVTPTRLALNAVNT